MDFGHIGLIILLFLLALIVFGPRKMIEMVTQLGETLRQTRDAMRQMNWGLADDGESEPSTAEKSTAPPVESSHVVESAPPPEEG